MLLWDRFIYTYVFCIWFGICLSLKLFFWWFMNWWLREIMKWSFVDNVAYENWRKNYWCWLLRPLDLFKYRCKSFSESPETNNTLHDYMLYLYLHFYLIIKMCVYYCGPRISAHAFPTRWRARFLFWKINSFIWLRKLTWSRYLFLFYF